LRIALSIRKHHDVPLAGHLASARTLELLGRNYYWNGMAKLVREYCAACSVCQESRVIRGKLQGQLQPLPIPTNPWEQIIVDFVTDLPASISFEGVEYDSILVVIDRFTKMAHFVPAWKDIITEQLVELFIREVIRLHRVPTNIATDRGSVFVNEFWLDLLYLLKISRDLSTAHHPQSDGQTERLNRVLEQYLRRFINFDQDNWVKWLPLTEFRGTRAIGIRRRRTRHFIDGWD
jgi:Integrase zinc binding domain